MTYRGRKIEWDVLFAWIFILFIGLSTTYVMIQYLIDFLKWIAGKI